MRIIETLGGPIIGLDRQYLNHWSGINGKSFVGRVSPFSSDYEAAGALISGRNNPPCNITKISGTVCDGTLITMPLQTALVAASEEDVFIAQLDYADEDWDISQISTSDFAQAIFDPNEDVHFTSQACTYMFFDAALAGIEVGDEFISFQLNEGRHTFSSAIYKPNDALGLILYKISV